MPYDKGHGREQSRLMEICLVFVKMGLFAFGGPAAHIAMMEREVVEKRKWITTEHFLDLMGTTNLIPGPNSTEMTMHCGHEYGGRWGLVVAGISFITPAILITGTLAWLYAAYGKLPEIEPFLVGIKPAILAIIAQAILKLSKKALKSRWHYLVGIAVVISCLWGLNEIIAIVIAGLFGVLVYAHRLNSQAPLGVFYIPGIVAFESTSFWTAKTTELFFIFLKVGSMLYGSGYVLFAYLDAELVERGMLTYNELMDAIAIGQFTPGPLLSTATFIGYQLDGWSGAVATTTGIFLPSFLFILVLNPIIHRIRKSLLLREILNMVNVGALAVMLAVLVQMAQVSCTEWRGLTVAVLSLIMVFKLKLGTPWIVLIGAGLGALLAQL